MRLMSFALTEAQLMDGSKTVTRRTGWANLRAGERLCAVRKAMGLRPGEKVVRLCEIDVVDVQRVPIDCIDVADCIAEGFPHLAPLQFVAMFAKAMNMRGDLGTISVTRIEFRKVPGTDAGAVQQALAL